MSKPTFKGGMCLGAPYDDELKCYRVFLQSEEGKRFVVLDYRVGATHKKGEISHDIPNLVEIDKYKNEYEQYSNEALTKGHTTTVSVDDQGKCETVSALDLKALSHTEIIAIAGAALNLKAASGTSCSLDECTQAVLGYAIKLMQK